MLGAVLGGGFVLALELEDHFVGEIGGPFLPALGVEAGGFDLGFLLLHVATRVGRLNLVSEVFTLDGRMWSI